MGQNRRCNPACACADALRWLDANGPNGHGHGLAPLTGTSTEALKAIAHLWQLYAYSRSEGVLRAIGELMPALADSASLARELIAWAMDWGDREPLWREVLRFAPENDEFGCKRAR